MQEKIIKLLPLGLITAVFGKILFISASLESIATLAILAALHVVLEYKDSGIKVKALEQKINLLTEKVESTAKTADEAKSHAASLKMVQQKTSNIRF